MQYVMQLYSAVRQPLGDECYSMPSIVSQHHFSLFLFEYHIYQPYCHHQQLIVINMPVTVISLTCGGAISSVLMLYGDIDAEFI